jgi:hypothetical protein
VDRGSSLSIPYVFLGKFEAFRAGWGDAAECIVKLLMKHDRMFTTQSVRFGETEAV